MRILLTAAVVFAAAGQADAQQTVYVGGSGLPPVEVNMGVLDTLAAPRPSPRVVLDPPGQMPRSSFLLNGAPSSTGALQPLVAPKAAPISAPEPKPVLMATPTPTLPKVATITPSLPEPAAAPVAPVTSEALPPIPEPAPVEAMPEPAPEPAPPPEPAATVATLTPAPAPAPTLTPSAETGDMLRIPFVGDSSELPGGADQDLRVIAEKLAANDGLRAQVKAYADGSTGSASTARRLSLSRALAVRSILIELGVRSTRIDVRALGDRNEGGAPDRVDVLVINR